MSNNDLIIYLIVRQDLPLSKGKTVAQCCHAVEDLVLQCSKPLMHQYRRNNNPKITLKCKSLNRLLTLEDQCKAQRISHSLVIDAGQTEVLENTPTVLGIGPIPKSRALSLVGDLKLL